MGFNDLPISPIINCGVKRLLFSVKHSPKKGDEPDHFSDVFRPFQRIKLRMSATKQVKVINTRLFTKDSATRPENVV